jgi:hypothetical protein
MSDVGKTARCAFEFMRQFYRDVQALVTTVEQQLATKNWHTALGTKIVERSSNSLLLVDNWMPDAITRIYARQGQADRATEALALSIEFSPESFDEPICLVVGARFAQPSSCADLWSRWKTSNEVLATLPRYGTTAEIARPLLDKDFMLAAQSARAFVVPLCDFTDARSVKEKLVDPALTLLA